MQGLGGGGYTVMIREDVVGKTVWAASGFVLHTEDVDNEGEALARNA